MYSQIVKYILKPLDIIRDEGYELLRNLRHVERTQWLSRDEIHTYQWRKLKTLLMDAYENIPFYRKRLRKQSIHPDEIKSYDDFRKIPILTKQHIQENLDDLINVRFSKTSLRQNSTGGSTGQPLIFYQDDAFWHFVKAIVLRHDRWAGLDWGKKYVVFWGAERDMESYFKRRRTRFKSRYIDRCIFINAFNFTEEKMKAAIDEMLRFQPEIIQAYASAVYLLAQYISECNIDISSLKMKGIISAAETLSAVKRNLIESVFGCAVFNRYGSRDMNLMASECEAHDGMHIAAENVFMEFIGTDGQPVSDGQMGEIIVTGLNNFSMPLIRYAIGDIGKPSSKSCICGRGLPLLQSIDGRVHDIMKMPNGKIVHGEYFNHLFYGKKGIKQYQIIQEQLDKLSILVVPDRDFNKDLLCFVEKEIKTYIDDSLTIEFKFVENIPLTKTGKLRYTISKVPIEFAGR